jgi:hypothetical protein
MMDYARLRRDLRRTVAPRPSRPTPSRAMLAGSGIAAAVEIRMSSIPIMSFRALIWMLEICLPASVKP